MFYREKEPSLSRSAKQHYAFKPWLQTFHFFIIKPAGQNLLILPSGPSSKSILDPFKKATVSHVHVECNVVCSLSRGLMARCTLSCATSSSAADICWCCYPACCILILVLALDPVLPFLKCHISPFIFFFGFSLKDFSSSTNGSKSYFYFSHHLRPWGHNVSLFALKYILCRLTEVTLMDSDSNGSSLVFYISIYEICFILMHI